MDRLPAAIARVLALFAPVFSRRIWVRAQVLLLGAILAPGARTVAAALRVMGQADQRCFPSYHRVSSNPVHPARFWDLRKELLKEAGLERLGRGYPIDRHTQARDFVVPGGRFRGGHLHEEVVALARRRVHRDR